MLTADLKFEGGSSMATFKLHVLSSHPARCLATSSHGCMHAKAVGHQKVWLGPADLQAPEVTPAQAATACLQSGAMGLPIAVLACQGARAADDKVQAKV